MSQPVFHGGTEGYLSSGSSHLTSRHTHTQTVSISKFDVWLNVHHSSMWNKKPTTCHLVLYLFLLYKLLNMFRATLCPSSGADDLVVFFRVWCTLCYILPNGHTTSQPDLTAYTTTALHHTRKNTTKSSAPEDGHKVARNMLSNL